MPAATDRPLAPPPPPPPPSRRPQGERVTATPPWRDRLPEVAATIGALLVAVASAGFVQSSWEQLGHGTRAMLLGLAAAGLTSAGLWSERFTRRGVAHVTSLVLATASGLVAGAVTLGAAVAFPGMGRLAIALGGVAALAHAGWLLQRRRASVPQVVAAWAAGVYAVGPFGNALADRFDNEVADGLLLPMAGFFDPTVSSDLHLLPGVGHLLVGALALAALRHVTGGARHVLRVLAILTIGFAALEVNVLASSVGAVAALGIVIGFLLYGLATDDGVLVVAASTGALAAGVRVLFAVFTGQVVATILVLAGGVALLGWALRAMRLREEEADRRPQDDAAPDPVI